MRSKIWQSMDVTANNVNRLRWYIVGNQFVSHRGQRQVGVADKGCRGSLGGAPIIRHFHPVVEIVVFFLIR